ncbi:unnamed protein product, partial [marine sediment metagenome]
TGRVVGVMRMGNWIVDVEQEILDAVNEEHGMPDLPDSVEGILKEIDEEYGEDQEGQTAKELEKQYDEEEIDENDLRGNLSELRNEDYQYADAVYADSGQDLAEILDSMGWDSEVGQTILKVMETEGWEAWRNNWGDELSDAEERIRDQRTRLADANTISEKVLAINLALNEEHVYGTMAEHMDIGKDELQSLSEMGDSIKSFNDLVRREYKDLGLSSRQQMMIAKTSPVPWAYSQLLKVVQTAKDMPKKVASLKNWFQKQN